MPICCSTESRANCPDPKCAVTDTAEIVQFRRVGPPGDTEEMG